MALGLADDKAMQAETAQLVGHLAGGDVAGSFARQRIEVLPQVTIGEPPGQQTKTERGTEQRKHGWIAPALRPLTTSLFLRVVLPSWRFWTVVYFVPPIVANGPPSSNVRRREFGLPIKTVAAKDASCRSHGLNVLARQLPLLIFARDEDRPRS